MAKLIMTTGLPRSGKTTWAKEYVDTSGNAVRINRDDLRAMLHNGKWSPKNEDVTMAVQKAMVLEALRKGKSVVVDDTNLGDYHKARWEGVAKEAGATFEVKKFGETDLRVLIARDKKSDSQRGAHVIIRLAMENGFVDFPEKSVVICDIDGTMANCEHRRQYSHGPEKDWDKFFSLAPQDTLIESTAKMVRDFMDEGKTIIFVSARPERCRKDTEDWLASHGFVNAHSNSDWLDEHSGERPYFALLMRADGDSRDDTLTKQGILDKQLKKEWIHTVIDDRPKVIRMWESNGLSVIDVGDGVEF